MYLEEIIEICKEYQNLGWAIQDQLDDIVSGKTDPENYNLNALYELIGFLQFAENWGLVDAGENIETVNLAIEEMKEEKEDD